MDGQENDSDSNQNEDVEQPTLVEGRPQRVRKQIRSIYVDDASDDEFSIR